MDEHQHDGEQQVIDALRLSEDDRALLVAELESGTVTPPRGWEKRKAQRLCYDAVGGLVLHVPHHDGSSVGFIVKPRDLSSTGMGVLHGAFIYPGTPCVVPLRDLSGQTVLTGGCVAHCRHIRGRIHELGIQFNKPIDLERFTLDDSAVASETSAPIKLPTLTGRALVADEWNEDRQLLKHELCQLGLEPVLAAKGVVAWQRLGGQEATRNSSVEIGSGFSVVVAGEWLGDMTLGQLAKAMRSHNVSLPIVGIVSQGADEAALMAEGVNGVIHRPYRIEQLAQTLLQFLHIDESDRRPDVIAPQHGPVSGAPSRPALSERWGEPEMQPLILNFLQGFETRLGDLQGRLRHPNGDDDALRACLRLKAATASFGLTQLSDGAGEISDLIAKGSSPRAVKAAIMKLHDQSTRAFRIAKRYAAAA